MTTSKVSMRPELQTFSNISAMSWRPALVVEEARKNPEKTLNKISCK
jgi:hypothetical protein